MKIDADALREVVNTLGATGVVVFGPTGEEISRVGDLATIQEEGMFSALFGGRDAVQRLKASLDGQLLPQIWSQGGTDVFVSRLKDGIVYGVFSRRSLDPAALYQASQEATRAVEPILAAGALG